MDEPDGKSNGRAVLTAFSGASKAWSDEEEELSGETSSKHSVSLGRLWDSSGDEEEPPAAESLEEAALSRQESEFLQQASELGPFQSEEPAVEASSDDSSILIKRSNRPGAKVLDSSVFDPELSSDKVASSPPKAQSDSSDGEDADSSVDWTKKLVGVQMERVASDRGSSGYTLFYDYRHYTVYRPKPRKANVTLENYIRTFRCGRHSTGCLVKIKVNGLDMVLKESLPALQNGHRCERDEGKYWKERIQADLRKAMEVAMGDGRVSKFGWEAVSVLRKYTRAQQRLAKYTLYEAKSYLYERARNHIGLTRIPRDHINWKFDKTSDPLFLRDPTHSSDGPGGLKAKPGEKGFLLLDENFVYKDKKTGTMLPGKIVILGHKNLLDKWAPSFQGLCVDGTYFSVPKPFTQLVNLVFTVPVTKDDLGCVSKVVHIPALHVLLTSHSKEAYLVLWRWVKEFLPNLNVEFIMVDWEIACCSAFMDVYGEVMRLRCLYHFGACVRRCLIERNVYVLLVGNAHPVYRRWLRFLHQLHYFKLQHVRDIYLMFRKQVMAFNGEHSPLFQQIVLPYFEKMFIGIPQSNGKWKEPRYPFHSFSRHTAVLRGFATTNNSTEGLHSVINRLAGPHSGIYSFAEIIFYLLEMASARLLKVEVMMEDEEVVVKDEQLDLYITDNEYLAAIGGDAKDFVQLKEDTQDVAVEKQAGSAKGSLLKNSTPLSDYGKVGRGDQRANRLFRFVHEDSSHYIKKNPCAKEFFKERLIQLEDVDSQGYFSIQDAGRDLDLGFANLNVAVRSYAFYESHSLSHLYLWGRKVAHLCHAFGAPSEFQMTRRERAVFMRKNFDYDSSVYHGVIEEEDLEGPDSDVEDAVVEASREARDLSESSQPVSVSTNNPMGVKKAKGPINKADCPSHSSKVKLPLVPKAKSSKAKPTKTKPLSKTKPTLPKSSAVAGSVKGQRSIADRKTDATASGYLSSASSDSGGEESSVQAHSVQKAKRKVPPKSPKKPAKSQKGRLPNVSPQKKVAKKTAHSSSNTASSHTAPLSSSPSLTTTLSKPPTSYSTPLRPGPVRKAVRPLAPVVEESSEADGVVALGGGLGTYSSPSPIPGRLNRSISTPSDVYEATLGDLTQLAISPSQDVPSVGAASQAVTQRAKGTRSRVNKKYVFYSPPFLRSSSLPVLLPSQLPEGTKGAKQGGASQAL